MKQGKNSKECNKKRGKRLRECRQHRNMTQEMLAELAGFSSSNYISLLENGERPIDWNKAFLFAEKMDVSPAFIMCKSDLMTSFKYIDREYTQNSDRDWHFLRFVARLGHSFVFDVSKFDGTDIKAQLRELKALSIDSQTCYLSSENKHGERERAEVIINTVSVDGKKIPYSRFVYAMNRLYDYIGFTFDNLKRFDDEFLFLTEKAKNKN